MFKSIGISVCHRELNAQFQSVSHSSRYCQLRVFFHRKVLIFSLLLHKTFVVGTRGGTSNEYTEAHAVNIYENVYCDHRTFLKA